MQACVAAFTKTSIVILAHSWDSHAGGRDMDAILFKHFADEFMKTHTLDIAQFPKAAAKLSLKVARCRELLTASKKANISIESLVDDKDFRCLNSCASPVS